MAELVAPTLLAAVRINANTTRLTWENNATYSRIYIEARALPSGTWVQINSITTTAAINAEVYDHWGLNAALGYELRIYGWNATLGSSDRSGTQDIDPWVTVPAIQTDVAASYVMDGLTALDRHLVEWTNNETATGRYTWQYVHRWNNVDGAFIQINRLVRPAVGDPQSEYVDAAVPADRALKYRMHVMSDAGAPPAHSVESGILYSTPLPPTNVAVVWINGTTLRSTWDSPSTIATKWDHEYSAGEGAWAPLPQVTTRTADFTGTVGAAARVRVRAVSPDGAKASAWVESALMPAHRAPAAPLVAESGPQDATDGVSAEWLHQTLDGSGQGWWSVRHRLVGAPSWTTVAATAGDNMAYLIPAGTYSNGTSIEVAVQTRGASPDWSPWSDARVIQLRAKPSPTITLPAPAAVIASRDLVMQWTTPGTQLGWSVRVIKADGSIAGSASSTTATASRLWASLADVLDDATSYTAELTVTTTDGVSDPAVVAFSVVLQRPGAPTITVTVDHAAATLTATVAPVAGAVATAKLQVWASVDLVSWRLLGELDDVGGELTDWTPPLHRDYWLKARAVSGVPSRIDSTPVLARVESRDCWLNYGAGHSLAVAGGPSTYRDRTGRDKQTRSAGGRTLVFRAARALPTVADISVLLHPGAGSDSPDAWATALEWDGPVVFRDPRGLRIHGEVMPASRDLRNQFEQSLDFTVAATPDGAEVES